MPKGNALSIVLLLLAMEYIFLTIWSGSALPIEMFPGVTIRSHLGGERMAEKNEANGNIWRTMA